MDLHEKEIKTAYDIGSKLGIDKNTMERMINLMKLERELYDGWDKILQCV